MTEENTTQEEIKSLREAVARQESEIEQLRSDLRTLTRSSQGEHQREGGKSHRVSRAGLLKAAAGGAIGVAATGLALRESTGTALAYSPSLATVFEAQGNGGTSSSNTQGTAFATDTNNGADSAFYDIGVAIIAGSTAFTGQVSTADCIIGTTSAFYKSGVVGYGQASGQQPSGLLGVGTGVYGQAAQGVYGSGVDGYVPNRGAVSGIGVLGVSTGNYHGVGVLGLIDGVGIPDLLSTGAAVYAGSSNNKAVIARSDSSAAIVATSNGGQALVGNGGGGQHAVEGVGSGTGSVGVYGSSDSGTGVSGITSSTTSNAVALQGEITSTAPGAAAVAVLGKNDGTNANGYGVQGTHAGSGYGGYFTSVSGKGLYGSTGDTRSGAIAVLGELKSSAPGSGSAAVYGKNDGTNGNGFGVQGTHAGGGQGGHFTSRSGVAVGATSTSGRGGFFSGPLAQISLSPGTSSGTPGGPSIPGDIYLDKACNLYVCTAGGSPGTWKQVVLQ